MLFPTLNFGIFFSLVFITSWALAERQRAQKYFLIAASYFFYGYWDWRFLSLLFASSLVNYVAGLLLREGGKRKRRAVVTAAVALNLAILGAFKYYGFFIGSLSELLHMFGVERDLMLFEVILPIGISFFTFQGISYVVDAYRGDLKAVDEPQICSCSSPSFPSSSPGRS